MTVHYFAYDVCMSVSTYVLCMYVCTSEVPSAPIDIRVNEVTSSSLQVSWSAPASDGGILYLYYIQGWCNWRNCRHNLATVKS